MRKKKSVKAKLWYLLPLYVYMHPLVMVLRRVSQSIAHCQAILMLILSHYFRVLDSRESIIYIFSNYYIYTYIYI